jgi:hypothetical protein
MLLSKQRLCVPSCKFFGFFGLRQGLGSTVQAFLPEEGDRIQSLKSCILNKIQNKIQDDGYVQKLSINIPSSQILDLS